tara:strand:- start:1483 stop:1746 length:264 start_codon:yes stop_codon:yes gene_type:complete
MWLNQYNQQEEVVEERREVYELDPKLTKMMKDSLYGNFGGDLKDKALSNGKSMLTGAIMGIMVAVYFGKSPLYFGLGGAVLAKLIAK